MRGSGTRARPSLIIAKLGLWYFVLLLPTMYFKYAYLDSMAEEGVLAALDAGGLGVAGRAARYVTPFAGDFTEVLLLVLLLFAIGVLLLRLNIDWVVGVSVFLGLVVSAGNWLSFEVAGTLLNLDNLALATAWMRDHPEVVTSDRSGVLLLIAGIGLLILALLWAAASFLGSRSVTDGRATRTLARGFVIVIGALQLVAASMVIARRMRSEPVPPALRGYWSTTAASIAGRESWHPLQLALPSVGRIDSTYRQFAYAPEATPARPLVDIPLARRVPRHIVIVSLETAPRKYYPLADNADLPTFQRMGQHGIVSEHHYTTDPATMWAIFTMLSGTYPHQGKSLLDYGDFSTDGVASVLGRHGYDTFFVDSYKIDWQAGYHRDHSSRMLHDLGIRTLVDATHDTMPAGSMSPYARAVARERRSFTRALESISASEQRGTHAMVFIATILGHYPWSAAPGQERRPGKEKLAATARVMDGLMGEFLHALDERGLHDSTIVVVTGDHGLRAKSEFASLGEDMRFGDVAFNVPFILYAPGLLDAETRLPYVTSHVDIAPTLLELVGIRTDSLLLHGASVLGQTQRRRTTFMLNNSLRPVDGYYRDGYFFVFNRFTGQARVARGWDAGEAIPPPGLMAGGQPSPGLTRQIASEIDRAKSLFDAAAASFLQRVAAQRATLQRATRDVPARVVTAPPGG